MDGIEIRNVCKTYLVDGVPLEVLKGIDLELQPGKITILLGRSGCGKTTLLRLIGGLEDCDQGEVTYHSVHKSAFVFQEPRLMPWLNAEENICFGLKKRQIDQKKIQKIVTMAGLDGFTKAYPSQLSGGMQQRTAIARALAYDPSFILMDEPFAALDYFTREQMQKEVIRVQKENGCGILFVTHSIDEALILGHKIVVMKYGKIHASHEILQDYENRDLMDTKFLKLKQDILKDI